MVSRNSSLILILCFLFTALNRSLNTPLEMSSKNIIFASLAILCGVFYQVGLKDLLFVTFGVRRTYQKIEEFPYDCRRLRHPLLESCEDLVLDAEGRTVYAACSTSLGRKAWSPGSVLSQPIRFHPSSVTDLKTGGTTTTRLADH